MTSITTTSIVFTDLVGSTALSSRLGPTEADDLRRTHFSLLHAAVVAASGRAVKNLGDGLMAVFPSLSAALTGATNIQQRIELHNRSAADPLRVRVGVSTGDVTEDDGDYFGTPVIEAARLCDAAQGGQILTTELVRALAGQRGFTFIPAGHLTLKGLPQPTVAVEVVWDPLPAEDAASPTDQPTHLNTIPIPARVTAAASRAFVGRATERRMLAAALSDVTAGKGSRVALLAGEPGLGKTSLAARFATDAHESDPGAVVLYGRCEEELAVPYLPFAEAIEHLVTDAPDDFVTAYITREDAELAHLVPALARRAPAQAPSTTADPDTARYVLFAAIAGLFKAVSAHAPVVLILDDLHWADKATLLLLRHLITAVELPGVLMIGTYRDSELHASHPLADALAALRREPGVERIALPGLAGDDLALLLRITTGNDIDSNHGDLVRALHAETDGNPFFVGEILRHLVEAGHLHVGSDGRWIADSESTVSILPESIREVVGQRIARLGPSTHRVLASAAVIGRDFDLDLLAAVTTTDHDTLLDQLEEARAASLVDEIEGAEGHFTFAHALIQHTLYDELGATRRARMHARVAEAIEEQCGPAPGERVGEIARHWLAAVRPADPVKARTYAGLAADRALAGRAPDEAVRWYEAALGLVGDEPPDLSQRVELMIGLGQAQLQTGAHAYRETLLGAAHLAQANGDHDALVRAALANSRGFVSIVGQVDAERVAVLEAALDGAGRADSPARARLLATLAAELTYAGDPDGRIKLAREAEAVARRIADPRLILDTLNLASLATQVPPLLGDRVGLSAEAVELAARIDDPSSQFWAASFRATVTAEAGDGASLREAMDAMENIANALGQPVCRWRTMVWQSTLTCLSGRTDEAERLAAEALQIGSDAGEPDALAFYGATLATIRIAQGRLAEIANLLGDTADANPGLPAYRAVHATALLDTGDTEAATAWLDRAAAKQFTDIPMDPLWTIALGCWADVAARVGDRDAAAALTQLLEPWHGHVPIPTCAAHFSIAHWLGILATACGNYDTAERYLVEALEIHERLDAPYLVAGTELALADMLALRGRAADQGPINTLLASSLDLATRHNLGSIEHRARSAMASQRS